MARIRQIKPEFFRSEDVAGLDPMARLLFVGLWTIADREGRLPDRPRRIAADIFPYDRADETIEVWLGMLATRQLIERYRTEGGQCCIQITGFAKHQKPHPKEPASELAGPAARAPAPPPAAPVDQSDQNHTVGQSRGETRPAMETTTANNVSPPPSSVVLGSGSLGSGSLGSGVGGETSASLRSSPPVAPSGTPIAEFAFRCDGKVETWWLTQEQLGEWERVYPSQDVIGECRRALTWTRAKPSNRKTAGGMAAFLVNWLNRAQDRGGQRAGPTSSIDRRAAEHQRMFDGGREWAAEGHK